MGKRLVLGFSRGCAISGLYHTHGASAKDRSVEAILGIVEILSSWEVSDVNDTRSVAVENGEIGALRG